jgi:hypothetical protein
VKTMFSFILLAALIAFAVPAMAERTKGEFPSDTFSVNGNRYTTDMAPKSQAVVKVTKGFYNLDISQLTQYKFWFTKTVDDTAATVICKAFFGGYITGSETGVVTAGDKWVKGKGQNFTGFKCASSAGTNINFITQ